MEKSSLSEKNTENKLNSTDDPKELLENAGLIEEFLSPKHKEVVSSMKDYYEMKNSLTSGQTDYLKKILDVSLDWYNSFDDEKRKKFDFACKVYKDKGYWTLTVNQYERDSTFIPNENSFNKMTQNKYFKGYWEAWHSDPKFAVGDLVTGRDHTLVGRYMEIGMIMKINSKYPENYGKGSKVYEILVLSSKLPHRAGKAINEEEKNLKNKK